ncbi:hypothetical protein [Actinoalloteichus caeruleus]|uniref:hypothetical protein n=1 Tax=Actinoalloteichus cyanogriseus TaxID=2893586 RepID=UPI003AB07EBC
MSHSEQEVEEMLRAAWRLPYGASQVAAAEEVVRRSDAVGRPGLRYASRILAVAAYQYGGEPAKMVVPFSWCLAAYDRGESDSRFDHQLFWYFKGVIGALTSFPEVSLDRTRAVLADMERRYRLAGHGVGPVHQRRARVHRHLGDLDAAEEEYRLWCASPRSAMSDCAGCEPSEKVYHLEDTGRYEEAVALAAPVLDGELACTEQPHGILTALLRPYLRVGALDDAADAHRRAYRAVQHDRSELALVAEHIRFCALSGNEVRGLELVERHLGWLDEPPSPMTEMEFAAAASRTLDLIVARGHGDDPVRRPGFREREATTVPVARLRDELADRALAVAARFDERNGTSHQSESVRGQLVEEPLVDHLPLSGLVRRGRSGQAPATAPTAPGEPPTAEVLPERPEALAELAEREMWFENDGRAASAWERFDELCPHPEPALLARRLVAHGFRLADGDVELAQETWRRAMTLFARVGDLVRENETRTRLGVLLCQGGRSEEGLAEINRGLLALDGDGHRGEALRARCRLAAAYHLSDRTDDAVELLAEAVERAERFGDRVVLAGVVAQHARFASQAGLDARTRLLPLWERALEELEAFPPSTLLRRVQFGLASLRANLGELPGAYGLFAEAARTDESALRFAALHRRAQVALNLGRSLEAQEQLTDLVVDLEEDGQAERAAYVRLDLADACLRIELPDEAAEATEEALPALERLGDVDELYRGRFLLAQSYRALGHVEQALALFDELVEYCEREENPAGVAQMHGHVADVLDEQDRDAEAAERYLRAAEACRRAERRVEELENRRKAALSWHWAGEGERAWEVLSGADELAAELPAGDPAVGWQRARLSYDAARILAALGRLDDGLPRASAAAAGFRALDGRVEAAIADVLRGRMLIDLDRRDEAEVVLTHALDELPEGADNYRERVAELLGELRG